MTQHALKAKLSLHRETVILLNPAQSDEAQGGLFFGTGGEPLTPNWWATFVLCVSCDAHC